MSSRRKSLSSSYGGSSARNRSSHVPLLTSNAFYHPLSSRKLQAQRGGQRPTTANQYPVLQPDDNLDDDAASVGPNDTPQRSAFTPVAQLQRQPSDELVRLPPSRGTEVTEHETYERATANTSPTQGHEQTVSVSDSVRPLRKPDAAKINQAIDIGQGHGDLASVPSPVQPPRSLRSSFLMPRRSDHGQIRSRSAEGAKKLSSEASSQVNNFDAQGRQRRSVQQAAPKQKTRRVHEYFDGNTKFFLGGRWQNAAQKPINISTGVFAVVPCVLFFVSEASWLWHNISPAVPITVAYLVYICISSFLHASVSDPGVSLPPRSLFLLCCVSF